MGRFSFNCDIPTRKDDTRAIRRGSLFKRYTNTYSHDEEKFEQSVSKAVQYMAKDELEH